MWWYQCKKMRGFLWMTMKNVSTNSLSTRANNPLARRFAFSLMGAWWMKVERAANTYGILLRIKSCTQRPVDPEPYVDRGSRQRLSLKVMVERLCSNWGMVRSIPIPEKTLKNKFQAAIEWRHFQDCESFIKYCPLKMTIAYIVQVRMGKRGFSSIHLCTGTGS
jgi:hypothetical protein